MVQRGPDYLGISDIIKIQTTLQKMGQVNCCEAQRGDHDLIMTFNTIKTEDPVQTDISLQMKKSVKQKTLICHRGFEDGVDGDFVMEDPLVTEAVYNRMENLNEIDIHESYFSSRGNETHGYFRFRRTGIIYAGQWRKGVPHGYGKNFYPNGGIYEGSFVDGVPHGFGRFIMANGDYYHGEVKYGRANGTGTYQSQSSIFKGGFKDNVKHGEGEEKGDNFLFRGEYEYGQKKKGMFKFNGNVYEGEFIDSLFTGKGKLTTSEGTYAGQFKQGEQHGYGEFRWVDGSVYRGNYYKGKRQGWGQYFNGKNNSISKGIWKKGVLNGQGEYREPHGDIFKCVWAEGKISAVIQK